LTRSDNRLNLFTCVILASLLPIQSALSQPANVDELTRLSQRLHTEWEAKRGTEFQRILQINTPAHQSLRAEGDVELMVVEPSGFPVYYCIDNLNAARTVGTNEVWPGGSSGQNLTGSGINYLGIWDGGTVLLNHQEFAGRVMHMDTGSTSSHATHVAGTLIGGGIEPDAKGMAFEAYLLAWEWSDDYSEMAAAAAAGLRVSNHSYGWATGWRYSSGTWYWYGNPDVSEMEDYRFGYYSDATRSMDEIAYAAPNYLIVRSAGNDRNDYGPDAGEEHYVQINGTWVLSSTQRGSDGGSEGFDCIGSKKTAKNILTIGAIEDIPEGYEQPASVEMTTFSNWGPTDDGRIKPDLVANGTGLTSAGMDHSADYASMSGTSMASPNAAGSVALLSQHYENLLGEIPRSATLKGLAIHTADEAGSSDGPDYSFGWGLLNTSGAAEMIDRQAETDGHILEAELLDQHEDMYFLDASAGDEMRVTLSWTDEPGTVPPVTLDPEDAILVNDLDLRLVDPAGNEHFPWVLNPASPADPATHGDNTRDNIEQIQMVAPQTGTYALRVSHKGSISAQNYSLIASAGLSGSCDDLTPRSPEVAIDMIGSTAFLSWLPVTESVMGCPIVVDTYQIWQTNDASVPFQLLGTSTNTSFQHQRALHEGRCYYHVVAIGQSEVMY
jgi:hypothetical protein